MFNIHANELYFSILTLINIFQAVKTVIDERLSDSQTEARKVFI